MKKTLKSLPAVLFAALALTFLACSDDKDDDDEGGNSGGGGSGSIAEKYQGDYTGVFKPDFTLEAKSIKEIGGETLFDKAETKGGGTTSKNCEWDYLYSNGKKIGAVFCTANDGCTCLIGKKGNATIYYAQNFVGGEKDVHCGIGESFDYSDIDASVSNDFYYSFKD